MSLQKRVSVFITLIIIMVSIVSTYLNTTQHIRSKERGLLERGTALNYALANAAAEGLVNEDLDLIKKASYFVQASDVTLTQVYSDIWEAIDAYPFERLKEPPAQDAILHFRADNSPVHIRTESGVDFYSPILYGPGEGSTPVVIGYVRNSLSSSRIDRGVREMIFTNILVGSLITLFAIFSINILIGRLVTRPITALYESVSMFRAGRMPVLDITGGHPSNEIRELFSEFNKMCMTIREKEERLEESDKRIRSMFERVEHALFRLDRNGSVIESNPRFREMFGEVSRLCEIFLRESPEGDCLSRVMPEKAVFFEDRAIGKDGEELVISVALYPDAEASGDITGYDGYIIDITEKKLLEEKLIRSQKMEAVGTLAGGMAHDFNNLLTAILGYAEIILSMTKEGDPLYRPASIILEAATKGADYGKKILTVARKDKLDSRPVDVNEVIRSSSELLRRSIPKSVELVVNLAPDIPMIKADPSQLQQVIINLAVNARDAMPNGGRLTIETGLVGAENGAANAMKTDRGGFIKMTVADSGIGMDTATQRKIFDPFFTTKDMGKGTGLGLYIVHSIINNHGGYINLYSEPLKGTRFNIYLPVTGEVGAEDITVVEDVRGSGTILVIDDEPDVRELCRDMLEPLGYTVLLADSGNSGLNIYRRAKDEVSLVILDMIMPGMGGSEVFQALRTISPNIKVLLCSGYSQNGFAGIDQLLQQGAAGFVQKPFSRQTIAVSIKRAIAG